MKQATVLPTIVLVVFTVLCSLASCHSHRQEAEASRGQGPNDRPALAFTHWTDASELFIELPALVRGQESPVAAHVTKLDGFAALADGQVTVVLRGRSREAGPDERFASPAPSVPGIFRPVVRPVAASKRRLIVEIRAKGFSVDHDLGEITVFESVLAARAGVPEESEVTGRITFLKEQQWPIDFGTAVIAERTIRPTLRATGTIRARSDGEIVVTAPVAGRVASTGRGLPRMGQRVAVDDLLGMLAPRLDAADLASLELAVTSANLELRFAERERERLSSLRTEGAVPERRVNDALYASEQAQASLATTQRRLAQFRRVQRTAGRGEGAVQLRAPLAGTITAVHVAPGAFVEAGAPLFRVTDLTQVWLEARVAEADLARLGAPGGASFFVQGSDEAIELSAEALIARGQVLDPVTRTLSFLYAIDNAGARLSVGAFVRVFLANGDDRKALAIPESSLVDDGGVFVVFVQAEGEAFERRLVRTGARDRGRVEVLSGVRAGEHVVTRGAWSVKLAASSGSVPAHGHAH